MSSAVRQGRRGRSWWPLFILSSIYVAELAIYEYLLIYQILIVALERVALAIILNVCSAPFWIFSLWSLGVSSLIDPGMVPSEFDAEATEKGIPTAGFSDQRLGHTPGCVQFCTRCQLKRPERAHHCGTCGGCVSRMDHHCAIIGNCVGFKNIKAFVLWSFWTTLLCIYLLCSSAPFMMHLFGWTAPTNKGYRSEVLSWASGLFICAWATYLAVALALSLFTMMHISNILSNVTEVEMKFTRDKNPYDVGKLANWQQIFGKFDLSWFLPIVPRRPTCDGFYFPVKWNSCTPPKDSSGSRDDEENATHPLLSQGTTGGT